jgi:hypothetical protein
MATEGTGKNCAKDLGQGWKVSPSVKVAPDETFEMANIEGPGAIQQIWLTPTGNWRFSILRIYWDDQEHPSVEYPVGDFFACGWGKYAQVSSLAICVNPGSAFNCYWEMPFQKKCRMTLSNLDDKEMVLYYQINYTLTEIPLGRSVLSRPIQTHQSASLQRGLHHPRWRLGQWPLCWNLSGMGC